MVLKEIEKNGIPGFNKEDPDAIKKSTLDKLNWNSGEFKYYLSQLYQEKCKRFDSLNHLQSRKIAERPNHIFV